MRTKAQIAKMTQASDAGTRNVLDSALAQGNVRVVYASSVAAVNCSRTPDRVFTEDSAPEVRALASGRR
jgi:nucleoside-diphosphate-sugar epimerase